MLDIFLKGGPVMWPLLLVSVLAVAVGLDRLFFIVRERLRSRPAARERVCQAVRDGKYDRAIAAGEESQDAVARVLAYGLKHRQESFENAVSHAAQLETDRYLRGLAVLDTAITLAPLLGLLGTVTGMIRAFGLLGASELEAPAAITGGIAEALIATAYGLGIAIFALVPFNYVNNARERFERDTERWATELQLALAATAGTPDDQHQVHRTRIA